MARLYFGGREGRISTRLTRVRWGIESTAMTMVATSAGAIFHSEGLLAERGEKSVSTLPGMMVVTRMFSLR